MDLAKGISEINTRNDLWEYSLMIFPGYEVNDKIYEEHKSFNQLIQSRLKPQICIAGFILKEEMEGTMCRWIQNICNLHSDFFIELNNYSSFPPNTIYLRIQNEAPLKKLSNALTMLNSFITANDCPPIQITSRPHLAVATGLSNYVYEEAINIFSAKTFHEIFHVDKLVLIKKDITGKSRTINTFTLPAAPYLYE
jgi:hypothetical protein